MYFPTNTADNHKCEEFKTRAFRSDDEFLSEEYYGEAIQSVVRKDGRWFVENGEFATLVSFCPFCGKKL